MHAEHLGQHERVTAVITESVEDVVQCHPFRSVDRCQHADATAGDRIVEDGCIAPAASLGASRVVNADPACDREQPAASGPFGAIAMERTNRAFVDLLGEVVGIASVAEVSAELPDVSLGLGHETFERAPVSVSRSEQQSSQVVHRRNILAAGNRFPRTYDLCFVERDHRHIPEIGCDDAKILLSAAADGEVDRDERSSLDRHLAACADCASFADRLAVVDRRVRLRPAEPVPDLVMAVTSRVRPAVLGRGGWMRPGLAWVAVVLFAQNVAPLVFGETEGAETHLARHLGAFGVALAIGFAYVAWRPHRAFGMLPFVGALVVTMLASTGFDLADGGRSALAETSHLAELAGLALLWMIAGSPGWHGWAEVRHRVGDRFHPVR